jgi:thiol-disulfide isomerase/thioredoxin
VSGSDPDAPRGPNVAALVLAAAGLLAVFLGATLLGGYALYRHLVQPLTEARHTAASKTRRGKAEGWRSWRGTAAPALTLTTVDGKTIDLASLKGKRVVIDFWRTWCKPCVESIPDLNKLAKQWEKEAVVIGITDEAPEHVRAFLAKTKVDYAIVAGRDDDALPEPFRLVNAFPTLFFIDRDGTLRTVLEGGHHYDCLESRFWADDVAAQWQQGHREAALRLAEKTLEVHIEPSLEDDLAETFGEDPEYVALHDRVKSRIEDLVSLYERKYDRDFGRDRGTVVWVIWSFGAEKKDKEAVPILARYVRESSIEEARWRAADALWEIADPRAVPDLLVALHDPSLKVVGFAASALGAIGDTSAVGPLLKVFQALPDNREEAKAHVADALGKLGDKRAIAPLAASLQVIRDPEYVRWAKPALEHLQK